MIKSILLAGAAVLAIAAGASAQQFAPALQYYVGPSQGQIWAAPDAWGPLQFNAQTGTTYTILATDMGKVVTFANAGAIAVTLPVATTAGFEAGKCFIAISIGAGTATITPTTSTINGQATKAYATNAGSKVCSDGTNYFAY